MRPLNWFRVLLLLVGCVGGLALSGGSRSDEAPTGAITGVVRFTGPVPRPRAIPTTDGGVIQHSDLVVDTKTKGLRHVVAVLQDAPAQPKLKNAKPVIVDQRDMLFLPRVVAVQHGQPVRFENNDLCNHSVQANSRVPANQLNSIAGPNQPVEHTFEPQKGPVQIGCALHGWMRAWVYVVPHPWFAITDVQGQFRIAAVPPGKYQLTFSHPDTNLRETRTVEVRAGKDTEVEVEWRKTE